MLALHTNRPVKLVYGREESFVGHVTAIRPDLGRAPATRDGRLVCVRMRILLDGGAYASSSTPSPRMRLVRCGPYDVANALIESTCVYTNNPPCGAMRGFGAVRPASPPRRRWTSSPAALGSTRSSSGC
jgi:CO/xanthine dehydrogenase Mo-binding subunit